MQLPACRERDELEKQIGELLRVLSENSTKASDLAKGDKPSAVVTEFAAIHHEDTLLRDRLETLKYCVQLHKDCHGCR
jgi:hypothetical protein